ncbi:MAG: threonine-phosphate decarboxylase [Rubrobacter sp.]|nr:threonine-phosphate decarboxylase [Rubrobacter sp.]
MVKGWVASPDGRHHGAHHVEAARNLGVPPDGFLDFSANINPLGSPAAALAAGEQALHVETESYPDLHYRELRAALASYLRVSPCTVLPTNGGAEALFLAARTVAQESGYYKALILEPTFSEYAAAARSAGLEAVHVVARQPSSGFRLDLTVLERALEDGEVGLVFLCNPNNPTGDAVSRREVLRVARRAREAGAVLVVDEAFADFAPNLSVASEVDHAVLVARSFTKFFALPGLRLGCLVASDVGRVRAFQPSWPVNAVAAAAGIAATKESAFARLTLAEVALRRQELLRALGELPGITPYPGAANFLLVRGPQGLPEELVKRGILVRGCEPFHGLDADFFRVAVRSAKENGYLVQTLRDVLRKGTL